MNTSQTLTRRCEVTSNSEERADLKHTEQVVCGGLERFLFVPEGPWILSERCRGSLSRPGVLRRAYSRPERASTNGRPREVLASPFPTLLHSRGGRVPIVCAVRRGPPGSPHPPSFVRARRSRSISLWNVFLTEVPCFSGVKAVSEL